MSVKRVGVVGSGIMGSGIAEVAAKAGFEVVLRSRTQSTRRRDARGPREVARQAGRTGQARRRRARRDARARRAPSPISASSRDCDLVLESIVEDLAVEEAPVQRARPRVRRRRDPRDEHVDPARRRDGDGDRPPRAGVRHPLLQPGADDAAGRGRPADHDARRDGRRPRASSREACGKTAVEVKDQAGFIVNALLFPYLNNAVQAARRPASRPATTSTRR